jgi:hypothetical protein
MKLLATAATVVALSGAASAASAGVVTAYLYDGYTENYGSSISFSDPVGSVTANDIEFYTDNAGGWFPAQVGGFGASFGADIFSDIYVATAGTYSLTLGSDDGSYVFVNGALVGSEPGLHGYFTTSFDVTLNAGLNPVEVQFYNGPCCGSGVDLFLPDGASFAAPEPASWALMLAGFAGLGAALRGWRRKESGAPASAS